MLVIQIIFGSGSCLGEGLNGGQGRGLEFGTIRSQHLQRLEQCVLDKIACADVGAGFAKPLLVMRNQAHTRHLETCHDECEISDGAGTILITIRYSYICPDPRDLPDFGKIERCPREIK